MRANALKKVDYKTEARKGEYMPLKLKAVLVHYNISQKEWCDYIGPLVNGRGKSMSRTGASLLLNWGTWPKLVPPEFIRERTEQMLLDKGAQPDDFKNLWTVDKGDTVNGVAPLGRTSRESLAQPRQSLSSKIEINLPETAMLSQKAKQHFKLFRDPFTDDVTGPEDVFLSGEQRYIRDAMFYAARHGGFMAVIGESGAGKTTLRRDLIERIDREHLQINVIQPRIIDKSRLTAGAICDAIINDISSEKPTSSLEGKARQVERLLMGSAVAGNSHVLMIEEAHDLNIPTLKKLKRFWELEYGFKKLLSIILVGQPELKEKLNERTNWEAREVIRRIEVAELMPLNGNLEEYIALKFKRLDMDHTRVFDSNVYDAVRERLTFHQRGGSQFVSMVYPLVVNNTLVKAMNMAADLGADKVDADIVKEV